MRGLGDDSAHGFVAHSGRLALRLRDTLVVSEHLALRLGDGERVPGSLRDGAINACVACVEIGLVQRTFEFSPLLFDPVPAVELVAKLVAKLDTQFTGCGLELLAQLCDFSA